MTEGEKDRKSWKVGRREGWHGESFKVIDT